MRLDDAIHRLTSYDVLTTLPKRAMFEVTLHKAPEHSARSFAALVADVSGHEDVRLVLGSEVIGTAIQIVSGRLLHAGIPEERLARIGYHAFSVLVTDFSTLEEIENVARQVIDLLSAPSQIQGVDVRMETPISISVWPDDTTDPNRLLACAESAALTARQRGVNQFAFFSPAAKQSLQRRLYMKATLREAVGDGSLTLAYQPIVDEFNRRIVAYGALLRWSMDGAPVSSAEFIPIVEKIGLINEIGEWVITQACCEAEKLQAAGGEPSQISVNVSAHHIMPSGFASNVADIVSGSGIDPRLLQLEVTESAFMENVADAAQALSQLGALEIQVAVDDFGTGFPSLSLLRQLPIDTLKLD
jgi:predicted signal transduction protein with EAL and GGDEF domain